MGCKDDLNLNQEKRRLLDEAKEDLFKLANESPDILDGFLKSQTEYVDFILLNKEEFEPLFHTLVANKEQKKKAQDPNLSEEKRIAFEEINIAFDTISNLWPSIYTDKPVACCGLDTKNMPEIYERFTTAINALVRLINKDQNAFGDLLEKFPLYYHLIQNNPRYFQSVDHFTPGFELRKQTREEKTLKQVKQNQAHISGKKPLLFTKVKDNPLLISTVSQRTQMSAPNKK